MSIILLPVISLMTHAVSIDALLWTGVALCAALVAHCRRSRSHIPTVLASSTAVLFTSLALVTA
jgi:hypothetical protein